MIAQVIVDLKIKSIDKPFSYLVPERFLSVVEVGERCYVEFNNIKRMGIIIALKEDEDENIVSLKELSDLIDIEPILTEELINLAISLSKSSCYSIISYLLTMIPNVLKVNYSKNVKLLDDNDFRLKLIFNGKKYLNYNSLDKLDLSIIKEALKKHQVEIAFEYKKKESIKLEKYVRLINKEEKTSEKGRLVIDYLLKNSGESPWLKLRDEIEVSLDSIKRLEKRGIIEIYSKEVYRGVSTLKPLKDKRIVFTDEQNRAYKKIESNLYNNETYLLHGITGSGKTEIYLKLIEKVLSDKKEAIVLVPEISLTPMMVNRFKSRFGDNVAIFHSELSDNIRYDEWRRVLRGEAKIAVGARSAIFTPFKNIGIIIIDEEHEQSYKQDTSPIYHAKDVAERRIRSNSATLVLGSATPSVESYARAIKGVFKLVELKERANRSKLPETVIVDLNEEYKKGMKGNISTRLKNEISLRLKRGEQSLLLLNRRGYSNYIMCRACGYVEKCPNCDVSLTYHEYDKTLKCHYCGYETLMYNTCPKCSSEFIEKIGFGTEKLEEELKESFPNAKIVRMDNDTTKGKNGHEKILNEFENNGDILVGTQMIAKGLDFPNVTLVGVINADQSLKIPDFRSKETTFSLLTQVSGRAGRGDKPGLSVIQTYNSNHYAIKSGINQDYLSFFNEEMKVRKIARFVPFFFMTLIRIRSKDMKEAYLEASIIKLKLEETYPNGEIIILGPVKPTISRIDTYYIFNVILKYKVVPNLDLVLKNIYEQELKKDVLISIDRFPTQF